MNVDPRPPLRVGMVVRMPNWPTDDTLTITAIGRHHFLAVDIGNFEDAWTIDNNWTIDTEPYEECF